MVVTSGKISIFQSQFSEEFEGVSNQYIFQLSHEESERIWEKYINEVAASFFNLPDNNWIINYKKKVIGNWIKDYNEDKSEEVRLILENEIFWEENDIIWYCISKALILETDWKTFKRYWINFLNCDDDCPILINKNHIKKAILFCPIGDFIKVG